MPTDPDKFFKTPQPAAVLKHALLRRYLKVFASKTGKYSAGNRVVYVDGYAGRGLYLDGSPGSPAIAVAIAESLADTRDLFGILVEENKGLYDVMSAHVQAHKPDWVAIHGDVGKHLDAIFGYAGESPMLAFLDPFGLSLPFEQMVRFLRRSNSKSAGRHKNATEVLLNMSLLGISRPGGHLDKTFSSSEGNVKRLDQVMGGEWWHDIWRTGADGRVMEIVYEYIHRLQVAGDDNKVYAVPVADRWQAAPEHWMCLFTQHPDGLWAFNDIAPAAIEEFRLHCMGGQQLLVDDSPAWVTHIEANIASILQAGKPFTVKNHTVEVFGDALGYAREKYVRMAIKSLHAKGLTPSDGKGSHVGDLVVLPT